MKNLLYFQDGEVTIHKENIIFVEFNKFLILSFKNVLIELAKFHFLVLEGFSIVFFLEMS